MGYQTLAIRRDGPALHVQLNRPDLRNALNPAMIAELTDLAMTIRAGEIRVVVLSGAGPAFCAGADLAWMSQALAATSKEHVRDAERMALMFDALERMPVPLIGRIHGAALGGGAGLAAVCDIVVAEASATFGFPEVRLGLIPAVIAPYVVQKIGSGAARQLFLTGERFLAERALTIGLVQIVAASGALDAEVAHGVSTLCTAGSEAIAAAKQLIRNVRGCDPQDVISLTSEAIAARRMSGEGQEGMRAFLEKRRPRWTAE